MKKADFPRSLKDARGDRTQEQLGAEIGVAHSTICHWETDRTKPDGPALRQLSQALGYPLPVVESWFVADRQSA